VIGKWQPKWRVNSDLIAIKEKDGGKQELSFGLFWSKVLQGQAQEVRSKFQNIRLHKRA
jgi:hypothetical protein